MGLEHQGRVAAGHGLAARIEQAGRAREELLAAGPAPILQGPQGVEAASPPLGLRRASEEIDTGALDEVLVSMGRHAFVLHTVTDEYLLLAVLVRGGSLGRARFELRRAAGLLHDELT